jgi:hypothetical protein
MMATAAVVTKMTMIQYGRHRREETMDFLKPGILGSWAVAKAAKPVVDQ